MIYFNNFVKIRNQGKIFSDEFYRKFVIHDGNLKKQMGVYEEENIKNQNIYTIAINPKEYFEKFRNKSINKRHEGVKKRYKRNVF